LADEPIGLMENYNESSKNMFKKSVEFANRKWRTPFNKYPRIYPTAGAWNEAPKNFNTLLKQALTLDVVRGINKEKNLEQVYLVNPQYYTELITELKLYVEEYQYHPVFKYPMWGLPSHLMRTGMNYEQAHAASALFRVEAEALILELTTLDSNNYTNQQIMRYAHDPSKLVMPFWKDYSRDNDSTPEPIQVHLPADSSIHQHPQDEFPNLPHPQSAEFQSVANQFAQLPPGHWEALADASGYSIISKKKERSPSSLG
jgi:hypothetical protein